MHNTTSNGAIEYDKVVILDAGAQFGKVIDRRIRELKVQSDILPCHTPAEKLIADGYKGIIISGGPGSAYDSDAPKCDSKVFTCGLPVLGICYGMQLINIEFGGIVSKSHIRDDGQVKAHIDPTCTLFKGLEDMEDVLLTHADCCVTLAPGFTKVSFVDSIITAIADENRKLYGVQFHPEVDLTTNGKKIFENFLFEICKVQPTFKIEDRVEQCVEYIKNKVGNHKVLMLLSGGVDSTVCAALLNRALSADQIIAIHMDNGFMRLNESEDVCAALEKMGMESCNANNGGLAPGTSGNLKVRLIKAGARFACASTIHKQKMRDQVRNVQLPALNQTVNPEDKRRIIGDTFVKLSEEILAELNLDPNEVLLGQGTLRPDLIESASHLASSSANAIKTHHNDTALVRALRESNRVVEPLTSFHKDEVRQIGKQLNLPEEIVNRHPFPGPGLAIRVLCAVEPFIDRSWSETCSIIRMIASYSKLCNTPHNLLNKIKSCISEDEQCYLQHITSELPTNAILLPIQTVGVQGDCRTYSYCCALSTQTSPPDWNALVFFAKIIPRICHNINRVVYVFGELIQHPVHDVTVTFLKQSVLATLREADHRAAKALQDHNMMHKVSQMPVVLIPIHFDRDLSSVAAQPSILRSCVLRPFITSDFMTGIPAIPDKHLPLNVVQYMVDQVQSVPGISRVLYDLTPKPPGTTEWE